MCSSLSVNERGYYKWLNNGERPKKWQSLLAEIHRILDENPDNDNYGADRMLIAPDSAWHNNLIKLCKTGYEERKSSEAKQKKS